MGEQLKLIDEIFGDPSVKHGLNIFNSPDIKDLKFIGKIKIYKRKDDNKVMIHCFKRQKEFVAKPEEIVRQLFLLYIAEHLNYPLAQVGVEIPIQEGVDASKRADIVIFTDDTCTQKYIIFEVKKPDVESGLEQLQSYMNFSGVFFGLWSNGKYPVFQYREESDKTKGEPYKYRDISRLPKKGESLNEVLKPLRKKDLRPIQNLKDTITRLEDTALANAGVNTFDEFFKLFFAKLHDEFDPRKIDDSEMDFRVPKADSQVIYKKINGLFQQAKNRSGWKGIFDDEEVLKLKDDALELCASALEPLKFHDADLEVIDAAFEYLINPEQKGAKGQYFTPRMVVDMCVKMIDPQVNEKVIDPACGSGGFLIHTIKHVRDKHHWQNDLNAIYRYANEYLFATDFDDKLKKVAKVMMLIAGDGKANVFGVDALDYRKWARSEANLKIGPFKKDILHGDFDIVMTNPPFAGKITGKEQLSQYELYDLYVSGFLVDDPDEENEENENKRRTKRKVTAMKRDVLFLERCIRLLKPGGRIAIVLPQGNFNNIGSRALREWLMMKGRILAVVGLGQNTFKKFTGTKTSVLFFQKWGGSAGEQLDNYSIFMATSERSGKNSSGEYEILVDEIGHPIDKNGNKIDITKQKVIIDHDLDEIAEAFLEFCNKEKIKFY